MILLLMTANDAYVTEHTLNWVRQFIIGHNICPFAKAPVNKGSLRISVSHHNKQASASEELMSEIHLLDEHPKIETTLLVFAEGFKDFFSYLDLVDRAEQLLQSLEYEGIYQLATFHPDYYFADTEPDDVSNYTNRSPYPMLHVLREEAVEKAIAVYGDTDGIPERNINKMRELGLKNIKEILNDCRLD